MLWDIGPHQFRSLWISGNPSNLCCRCRGHRTHPTHQVAQ